jgi:hypothetical protein
LYGNNTKAKTSTKENIFKNHTWCIKMKIFLHKNIIANYLFGEVWATNSGDAVEEDIPPVKSDSNRYAVIP